MLQESLQRMLQFVIKYVSKSPRLFKVNSICPRSQFAPEV